MKYAKEVIELMAAYPGRPFVMRHLVRFCKPDAGRVEKLALQRSIHRVMMALQATGVVVVTKPEKFGGQNRYHLKT